jgi:predicted CoA-binding protein
MKNTPKTVVLGASKKPERYSYKAVVKLREHGHEVIPVHPQFEEIEGIPVVKTIADIQDPVDTVTVYLSPGISAKMEADLLRLAPRRVIFNPGAENPELQKVLSDHGILVEEACTLVLLSTGQY